MSALHFGRTSNPLKLIFAHANGFNAQSYAQILEPLGVHAAALDLRGHGFSSLPAHPDNLPNWHVFRDDIVHFCDNYVETPVVLAGHSFGAVSLILAAEKLGDKCAGYVGFDPVIMPSVLRHLSGFKTVRERMKKKLPIAARAGRRRSVFDNLDEAFDNYHGRGAFKIVPDVILRDYLEGGLKPHKDGVELACAPKWEQAVFGAQHHNTFRGLRFLPVKRHIVFAGPNSPTPAFVQAKVSRLIGENNTQSDDSLEHLFPLQNPQFATDILANMLQRVSLEK